LGRRADLVMEHLRAEAARREALEESVRRAIGASYEVTRHRDHVVRRRDVYEAVREAFDEPVLREDMRRRVFELVVDQGAWAIRVSQRRLFVGVRRHGVAEGEFLAEAKRLRTRDGNSGKTGKTGKPMTPGDANSLLEREGMPAELMSVLLEDRARAEINRAYFGDLQDAFWMLDRERAIARMACEGLSIRDVAARLNIDRNEVQRTLAELRDRARKMRERER